MATERQGRRFSRRMVLGMGGGAMLAALGGCGQQPDGPPPTAEDDYGDPQEYVDPQLARQEGTLQWAVSGGWRSAFDKARDKYQHPIETFTFFEIKPKDTVIDVWPGYGYVTEILAPYLTRGKGAYIAALPAAAGQAVGKLNDTYRKHFSANRKLYGGVDFTQFGDTTGPLVPPGTADAALFMLVVQDWMARGVAEKAFADAFAALKPGGILGVEQHRADIGNVQDPAATNGYVQEPFVKQLAAEAGFQFVAASEVNANPKDDKDHPFGVWTLPPQRLTAPRGQPPNPEFDGTLYESIGESDRMTLKFRKPQ